jgi:hypothetical protein
MPLYVYQATYTPETLAALIAEPHDRIEVIRPALEPIESRSWRAVIHSASMTCSWYTRHPMTRQRPASQ